MKTTNPNRPIRSALSRVVAHAENLAALAAGPMPFADFMLHPKKLKAVLNLLEGWTHPPRRTARRATRLCRTAEHPQGHDDRAGSASDGPLSGLINTEFHLEAPAAESVQMAADFTDWEKSPLDLIPGSDGVWFLIVPLLPGEYHYRFIVDGQWEDPSEEWVRLVADPAAEVAVAGP